MKRYAAASPVSLVALLGLAVFVSACTDSDLTGPNAGGIGPPASLASIPFQDLRGAVDARGGVARVEIKLLPDQLVAREIELEGSGDSGDDEEIRSAVTAVSATSVALALGDLVVDFDATTRLRIDEIGDVLPDQFVAWVQNEIDQGRVPWVRARRPAPVEPQAPEDGSFFATRLRVRDDEPEARIKINIDGDNIRINEASDSPDGWLDVLGLAIEVRQSEGVTEVEDEALDDEDDDDRDREFEGIVASVDVDNATFTLTDGAGFFLDENSTIDQDSDLLTLQDVADAVAAGLAVEAEGDADVEPGPDGRHRVLRVEFETDDEDDDGLNDDDQPNGAVEFMGAVTAADLAARTVTLADGTEVIVESDDLIEAAGDLLTLEVVRDAVGAGASVRAEGDATVETTEPRVLRATSIKFEVDSSS